MINKHRHKIDISVIIPIYNVEEYLSICIESIIYQRDLYIEIILVDDGSTDLSGNIADEYAEKYKNIKVIHQRNKGASAARNVGLDIAQGEYIVLLDSDDWIKKDTLVLLYNEAIKYQADIVMGNMWLCNQEGNINEPFKWVSNESIHKVLSGEDAFILLVKTCLYLPTPVRYIYKRKYLHKIQTQFEEGIMHEDELWSPIVLCQADRMVITDIGFYYYRQNEQSVMHTTHLYKRLRSLFQVTENLALYAEHLKFNDGDLKDWWYVNLYRLYSWTFTYLANIRDSSQEVPIYHIDCFWRNCSFMSKEASNRCRDYFKIAEKGLYSYINWRISDSVACVDYHIRCGKKVILIFNLISEKKLQLNIEDSNSDWIITTDRKYFHQANIVIFHLPSLYDELEDDLDKMEGQIWVCWYLENESQEISINDSSLMELFDISTSYNTLDECINKLIKP